MKTLTKIALLGAAVAVLVHLYLTLHYYPLKFGFSSGPSVCSVNAKFDCDAVAASSYSTFLGVPLALWGAMTNAVLFLLILFSWWGWSDFPERLKRSAVTLAGLSAAASVVMGLVSLTQLQNYCLFCIAAYALSFLIFECVRRTQVEPYFVHIKTDLTRVWTESKGILVAYAFIPVGAFLAHQAFLQNYGATELTKVVRQTVEEWQTEPVQTFVTSPALTMGPSREMAAMTLTEFADFRCSHCKHAAHSLHAFVSAHPDVRFEYYTFPLDGECNESIPSAVGSSCRLAEAAMCAEKQGQGWNMHSELFAAQDEILRMPSAENLMEKIKSIAEKLKLNTEALASCMLTPEIKEAIKSQARQGSLVNVRGTPTIFANGQQLSRGQLIPVLEEVRQMSVKKKTP